MNILLKDLIKNINFEQISKPSKNSNRLNKFKKYDSPIISKKSDGTMKIISGINYLIEA